MQTEITASEAQWIDNAGLAAATLPQGGELVVGLDTEFMRTNTFYPKLALIQAAVGGNTLLIDPLAFDSSAQLGPLLESVSTVCVMHSASEDMEAMADILPSGPARLFDTQIAAAMAGYGSGISYRALVESVCGVSLEKGETRSDWLCRPLSASQCKYAADDVVYLHALHEHLHQRLEQRGRLDWLAEDCARLTRRADKESRDPQPQLGLRAAAAWPEAQQALLRRLLLWREDTARAVDCPRPWLLDDKLALTLVAKPPETSPELFELVRGKRALRGAQRKQLLDELSRPVSAEEIEQTAPIQESPDRAERQLLKQLKHEVSEVAESLDLPAGLLCPRRLLEAVASQPHWPEELSGWRQALLEPRLAPLLR